MSITKGFAKSILTIGTVLLLSTPLMAGYGPGDGTGNDCDGPADGTGNGPGDCSAS